MRSFSNSKGQIFPDDPLAIGFDVGDEDGDGGNGDENQSEEESSEVSDDDDGECKEFAYQSDASYSQGEKVMIIKTA